MSNADFAVLAMTVAMSGSKFIAQLTELSAKSAANMANLYFRSLMTLLIWDLERMPMTDETFTKY